MSFEVAYLERGGGNTDRLEERLVAEEARRRGIEVVWYSQKHIDRRILPLGGKTFIMGSTPAMHGAMRQLRIPIPSPNDYPVPLRGYLHRQIWRSTLLRLEEQLLDGHGRPVFVKPADRKKDFTGRVISSREDLYFFGSASRGQEIWCSDVVEWLAEYRVYVVDGHVAAVDHYAGDPSIQISNALVDEALQAYQQSGEAPAGYTLDFGVLAGGRMALVEANDGYSLGVYTAEGKLYADLLFARWAELLVSVGCG